MKITFLGDPTVPYMADFVSLDYTAVGSTYLGEVKDASVVVKAPTLTITDPDGLSQMELKDLLKHPAEYFRDTLPRKYGQRYPMSFEPLPAEWGNCHLGVFLRNDYDPTTAIPPYATGTVLKVQLFQRSEGTIWALVLRSLPVTSRQYERFGTIMLRFSPLGGEEIAYDLVLKFLQSLPLEKLKIV
ncbi:hypothetical protein Ptr902_06365 [Pyrenophora tritici-repentis]|nr:hypothetical protein PtrV1_00530 [Pyrenophora tritici-repentis]KAF7453246.1 hypothetical protein A1F99_005040 [Pyrenophora tritici-repentis]KAF7576308.1 hypothetical protein PtrM4_005480 [Pyrenophora tritici-repentis]KAI0584894.1 hypothetical protein Alg215_02761 [Pyrenophora tritici-repentis]KAI0590616.1 hypothetical protein Alg130_02038 [Pyrenophora tritici-repentis]